MHHHLPVVLALAALAGCSGDAPKTADAQPAAPAPGRDYPVRPVPFTKVRFTDTFWAPRMETNRTVTLPACFKKCEETGRIDNFAKAGGLMPGKFKGIPFDDSDVYKVIEGAAYSLAIHPDPELDKYLDGLIAKIAAAQEPDGYLYTARRLMKPEEIAKTLGGPKRWENEGASHELYNVGHLYEAAAAHFLATGKRNLLDIALKSADLLDKTFGPGKRGEVPGHEEIEMGLVKLFRVTGDERYLKLATFYIDERGNAKGHKLYGEYAQDHKPVVEQAEPVGHSVRAGYLYAGVADVAALTGDEAYRKAIDRLWENVVTSKLYLTAGVGSIGGHEGFGPPYELPNRCYNETCAAIANALWNYRMFLLHGDAKYVDVVERIVYNGFLSGIALEGDRFFYPNPLASPGRYARSPWFDCACCPTNVVRFIPSLAGYVYAVRGDEVFVNLYAGGKGTVDVAGRSVTLSQETKYPWDGRVTVAVDPGASSSFALRLRIPGWARNEVIPSDLYRYADGVKPAWTVAVNGEAVAAAPEQGYVVVRRTWKPGDRVVVDLPMPVRRVAAHEKVQADRGRVALERGPLVYCFEGVDNGDRIGDLVIAPGAEAAVEPRPDLLRGVTVLRVKAARASIDAAGALGTAPVEAVAVPYYAWAHRGAGPMAVWMAAEPAAARPAKPPTLASEAKVTASYVHADLRGVNDQVDPANSNDHDVSWLDWWPHRNTTEWVQYEFKAPVSVSQAEVYWFDDTTAGGGCGLPASWQVLYRKDGQWVPVENPSGYGVERDRFNAVTFTPVTTDALRLEVKLKKDVAAGVMEWLVK
jgi:DUF1680 family protein